ncbi:MAG: DUF4190 domain-containing protein [Bacteroidetes bacterium]|nr:DUF4190 domain-containing protein [Bacteroidota bacterium]
MSDNRVITSNYVIISAKERRRDITSDFYPDSIKTKTIADSITFDLPATRIIKFTNGEEKIVQILSQRHNTLFYMLLYDTSIIRSVAMAQIDTILPDIRKAENFGLTGFVLSLFGFIPLIGIPFAIAGMILGLKSLRKIKRFPTLYKGKGFGQASVVFGILGIIFKIPESKFQDPNPNPNGETREIVMV